MREDSALCSSRYTWDNLPASCRITSQDIENLLYEHGSLLMINQNGNLLFTNQAQGGKLNDYGRLDVFTPITFSGKTLKPRQNVEREDYDILKPSAVLLTDTTVSYANTTPTPRKIINERTTIEDECIAISKMGQRIRVATVKALALCENEAQRISIKKQIESIIYSDDPVVPVDISAGEQLNKVLSTLTINEQLEIEKHILAIEFYSKRRRQFNGLPSSDTVEKAERKNLAESTGDDSRPYLMLIDGLNSRLQALELAKTYLGIPDLAGTTVRISNNIGGGFDEL